jgi:hypothetical protein
MTTHHAFELQRLQDDLESRGIFEISVAIPLVEKFITDLQAAFAQDEKANLNQHSAAAVGGMVSSLLWEQPLTPIEDDDDDFSELFSVSNVLEDTSNYFYPVFNNLVNKTHEVSEDALYRVSNRKKSILKVQTYPTDTAVIKFYDVHAILHYDVTTGNTNGGILGYVKNDQIAYVASCQEIQLPYMASDIRIPMQDNQVLDDALMQEVISHFGIKYEPIADHLSDPAVAAVMEKISAFAKELSDTEQGESFEPAPEPIE